ncbi:hypothetical protein SPD48_04690 [Pseudogracilibacillus sp. SE30717A]|uniref:hypothetical protein n=1 Tax=Pseudogracilibacillus sp. SE30717A TaxID=3098293 RepID=UPI00300E2439
MNIKLIHELLTDKNIKMIATNTSIEEDPGEWDNHYKLQLQNGKWEFIFVRWEKSDGEEKVLKFFDDEETASKFFYLHRLNSYYLWQYIFPFEENNEDIHIGTPKFNFINLKRALKRLGIPEKYYSIHGELKEHSLLLEKTNEHESKVKFIGDNYKVISESSILENWLAYVAMYQQAYLVFLLDQECQKLIKDKVIDQRFNDEEYSIFLSPGV